MEVTGCRSGTCYKKALLFTWWAPGWLQSTGELPSGEGPRGAGQQLAEQEPAVCPGGQEGQRHPGLDQEWCGQQEQGGDRAPVLDTGEATPLVLGSALAPSLREGH